MRILAITRMWPTSDRPAAGSFVAERFSGIPGVTVVGPRSYGGWWLAEYGRLLLDAARARGPFDGIEAHTVYPAGLIGLLVARVRGLPLVVYAHGSEVRRATAGHRILAWLTRRVVRSADAVVANSEDTARHLRRLGAAPRIIPPGVDLSRFAPSPRPETHRILYLGGRTEAKGYSVAHELADTLLGPGLQEIAPDEVPDAIRTHDVVLMPSRQEGFGLVAVEAIASGRWVVASAVGGLPEIIQDGVNGTLVPDADFAGALRRVPDYDPFALADTVRRFGLEEHQEAMQRVWHEVIGRRKPGDA